MSIQVTVTLSIPSDDLLLTAAYGAGAKVYLYSAATQAGSYSLVGSGTAIVSGTESYEIWDASGTSTTWYKSRVGNSGATVFSDYGDPFQVGGDTGYTNLARVKRQLKITNTADDAFILDCVDAANAWLIGEVGRFYGPSSDTSRSFDIEFTGQKTLMIPGGVRSVTTLETRTIEGGSLSTVTASDYVLRPPAWDLLPGMTYDRIELITFPASLPYFTAGRNMAVVTSSTFGPAEPVPALTKIADTIAVWMYQSRAAGMSGIVGSLETGELLVNRVLTGADIRTIQLYRYVGPSLYAFPAF